MDAIKNQMKLFYDNQVISWHEHVDEDENRKLNVERCDLLVKSCEAVGIDKALCSKPMAKDSEYCTPEIFRHLNDIVYAATKRHPGKLYGMCYINPGFTKEAAEELERCVTELGMIGVKLYHQYFINDPVLNGFIEKCILLDVPVLMHAGKVCDTKTIKSQPRLSNGVHFAKIAKRYPEATFIMAHIGGGGDWQWSLKAIEDTPNVFIDMSGSVHDNPIIEESVSYLGADRILFGTDGSFASCIGKMLGADISSEEKRTILEGTKFRRFIERADKK